MTVWETPHGVEPVQLEVVRECHFKQKPCALCGMAKGHKNHTPKKTASCRGQWPRGCANCGRNKGDVAHFGAPASFNVLSSGQGSGNAMVYANLKSKWQEFLGAALDASGLPKNLAKVYAEGEITFPDRRDDRDQGNFRVVIEKALGDALEERGYIWRDDWTRYEFGQLTMRISPGESATRIVLFPAHREQVVVEARVSRSGEQMELA